MINEEVQRRVAYYYMEQTMSEKRQQELESALIDKIWQTNEHATDDELVKIGVDLINQYLLEDEEAQQA